jgi:hypothetical protein
VRRVRKAGLAVRRIGFLLLLAPFPAGAQPLVRGLDHIPVVVADLEKAEADFRALGFRIKPGRLHADGIQNAHVKFPDGTEIELITAPNAVDPLTEEYRNKAENGEGPVYFGLYAPDQAAIAARLAALSLPVEREETSIGFPPESALHPLFFGTRNKSPTDKPDYFAHPNTAERLSAIWVRDRPELRIVLAKLGVPLHEERGCGPIGARVTAARMPEGELYLVSGAGPDVIGARKRR